MGETPVRQALRKGRARPTRAYPRWGSECGPAPRRSQIVLRPIPAWGLNGNAARMSTTPWLSAGQADDAAAVEADLTTGSTGAVAGRRTAWRPRNGPGGATAAKPGRRHDSGPQTANPGRLRFSA